MAKLVLTCDSRIDSPWFWISCSYNQKLFLSTKCEGRSCNFGLSFVISWLDEFWLKKGLDECHTFSFNFKLFHNASMSFFFFSSLFSFFFAYKHVHHHLHTVQSSTFKSHLHQSLKNGKLTLLKCVNKFFEETTWGTLPHVNPYFP